MDFFDLHCDTAYECFVKRLGFSQNGLAVSAEGASAFGRWSQVFAVWIADDVEEPYKLYRSVIDSFKKKIASAPSNLTPYFAIEGGAVIGKELELLNTLKEDGVRYLTLTWNGENELAGGCKTEKGLTDFGKEAIKRMNRLKICCDLSHLNKKSFFKALETADYPIASHSNSCAVCDSPRNLTDEQLCLLGEKGGLIGLNFYPPFLGESAKEGLYRNIAHMLELGLEKNIAIGSDFDGGKMNSDLSEIRQIPKLYNALSKKGIAEEALKKIFYENAQNYFDKIQDI